MTSLTLKILTFNTMDIKYGSLNKSTNHLNLKDSSIEHGQFNCSEQTVGLFNTSKKTFTGSYISQKNIYSQSMHP